MPAPLHARTVDVATPEGGQSTRRNGLRRLTYSRGNWLVVALWMGCLALIRSGSVEERDPFWQIRAGVETLQGQPLTRPDSWSWAPVSTDFSQTSPGWNVLLGLAWNLAGFTGFFLTSLVTTGGMLALLVVLSRRLGAGPLSTLAGLSVVLLVALPFLSPRATVAAQAVFLGSIVMADRWREIGRRYPIALGGAGVLLGAAAFTSAGSWLHLSWLLLAPAMALSWIVLWVATPQLGVRRILTFSVASCVGAGIGLVTGPYRLHAWQLSRDVQAACSGLITEWLGMFTPGLAARWALPGLLAVLLAGRAALWVVRRWPRRGLDDRVGLVGALTVLALPASLGGLSAIRFIGVALLALSPVVALGTSWVAARVRQRLREEPRGAFRHERVRFWAQGRHWRPVLVTLLIVLFPGVVLMTAPLGRPSSDIAVAQRLPQSCRLFSDPGSAAAVLLLRPDVLVWIDGRADYYGRDRNREAIRTLTSSRTDVAPVRQATCIILDQDAHLDVQPLVGALDRSDGWQRIGASGTLIAWKRR